jgi:hypothetical protein
MNKYFNKSLVLFLLAIFMNCNAQSNEPFFEEIAFNFYKSEILKNNSNKKRLKITENFTSIFYISAECLTDKVFNEKNIVSYQYSNLDYLQLDLSNINSKQFKVVKKLNENSNRENYITISRAQIFNSRIFVVINKFVNGYGEIYTFEFNKAGEIIDFCLSGKYMRLIFE